MTPEQIENATSLGFNKTVSDIYLEFSNKRMTINWTWLSDEVLFIALTDDFFYRCFHLKLYPQEPKYQAMISISKLAIDFRHENFELFAFPENEEFSLNRSLRVQSDSTFFKKIVKLSNRKGRCRNYKKAHCTGRFNCIDRCISRRFLKKYKSITSGCVINKRHFTRDQWRTSLLNRDSKRFLKISKICEEKFSKPSCYEEFFEGRSAAHSPSNLKARKLELYYDVIRVVDETPSGIKLLLDLAGIQSVLFGHNVYCLLTLIYHLLRIRFQIKHHMINLFLIRLCLSVGFLFHVLFIFNNVLNGELLSSQYHEVLESIAMPEVVFCTEANFDQLTNHSGDQLLNLTSDLRAETIFEKFAYLNESNDWVERSPQDLVSNAKSKFRIEVFFFLTKKCFNIRLEIEYTKRQFYFSEDSHVLKVKFNETKIRDLKINQTKTRPRDHPKDPQQKAIQVHFFTMIRSTMQFSKISTLDFSGKRSQICNQELLEIKLEDNFSILKNPLLIFYEESDEYDVDQYLMKLLGDFQSTYNSTTLLMPLEKTRFHLAINDRLFHEYWKNVSEQNIVANYNFQRLFPVNFLAERQAYIHGYWRSYDTYDFYFSLVFLKKVTIITNEDSWISLILNLLNLLFLWFNLGLLDLPNVLSKILLLFLFTVKWLTRQLTKIFNKFAHLI